MVNHVKWLVQCLVCLLMHSMHLYALHPFYSLHGLAWGFGTEGARKLVATAATPRSRAAKYDSPWYSVSGRNHKRYRIGIGTSQPLPFALQFSQSYDKLVAKKKSLKSATTTMAAAFSLQRLFHLFCSWHDAPEDDNECFCTGLCKAEQS